MSAHNIILEKSEWNQKTLHKSMQVSQILLGADVCTLHSGQFRDVEGCSVSLHGIKMEKGAAVLRSAHSFTIFKQHCSSTSVLSICSHLSKHTHNELQLLRNDTKRQENAKSLNVCVRACARGYACVCIYVCARIHPSPQQLPVSTFFSQSGEGWNSGLSKQLQQLNSAALYVCISATVYYLSTHIIALFLYS